MVDLNDAQELRRNDPSDALGAVASMADQILWFADSEAKIDSSSNVALFAGMGGSGASGDLAAALATNGPVLVHRGYGVPAWVGPGTFFVASSYSGNTEETLSAMSAAIAAGAEGCVVTSGGRAAELASEAGWATVSVPGGLLPRYAIGYMAIGSLRALAAAGFVDVPDIDSIAGHLRARRTQWGPDATDNPAKQLARRLDGLLPVIWGGQSITSVAATRFRCDLNENAKVLAHSASLPELDHNEIVGLAADGRESRPDLPKALLCLRSADDSPEIAARFKHTVAEVADDFADVIEVKAEGVGPLERYFDLAMLSGYVSVYLALMRGVDPAPIASIDRLKAALAHQ